MEYLVILNQRNQTFGNVNHETLNDVVTENGDLFLAKASKEKDYYNLERIRVNHKKSFEASHKVI